MSAMIFDDEAANMEAEFLTAHLARIRRLRKSRAELLAAAKAAVEDYRARFEDPTDFAGFNVLHDAIAKAEEPAS
jgi:hypothetical protein